MSPRSAVPAILLWSAAVGMGSLPSVAPPGQSDTESLPSDWKATRLDLDVTLDPGARQARLSGALSVIVVAESAQVLSLRLNNGKHLMTLDYATLGNQSAAIVDSLPGNPGAQVATFKLEEWRHRGDTAIVHFTGHSTGRGFTFAVDTSACVIDEANEWYPLPTMSVASARVDVNNAPGLTRVRLPRRWRSVSNGAFRGRSENGSWATELWQVIQPVSRSIAAGPYELYAGRFGSREFTLYRLRPITPAVLRQSRATVRVAAHVLGWLQERLGPFPYAKYAAAEVPDTLFRWWGDALKDFLVERNVVFHSPDGGLGVFAHEASHAWWGNLVVPDGPGSYLLNEGMAQYLNVAATSALTDSSRALEGLDYGGSTGLEEISTRGWFEMWRTGRDKPLATLSRTQDDYDLAQSKGVWVLRMLNERLGDDRFFGALRSLIAEYGGRRPLTLDAFRGAVLASAPGDSGLEQFLGEWLDRTGAPIVFLDVVNAWDSVGLKTRLTFTQLGDPYSLDVDVEMVDDAETHLRAFHIQGPITTVTVAGSGRTQRAVLDPKRKLLLWRPEFGPIPSVAAR
jgi:hypothetical protein